MFLMLESTRDAMSSLFKASLDSVLKVSSCLVLLSKSLYVISNNFTVSDTTLTV